MKRNTSVDLSGKIILVTGARVKIGYCVALKLLRMNATVLVTTRFPHDAARRYAQEPDFHSFSGRLHIHGLDFRDMRALHAFCALVKQLHPRLDALVNNAAQTVRRGPGYYAHLLPGEREPLPRDILDVARVVDVYRSRDHDTVCFLEDTGRDAPHGRDGEMQVMSQAHAAATPLPALLSQVQLLPTDDAAANPGQYPTGLLDRDDQQVDLQAQNSWTLSLSQVSTVEMVECMAINTFAPFILCNELLSMLRAGRMHPTTEARYIVNVSAMEGQFYRKKTHDHPHTNMAKAAFNMLTRTSAGGLMKEAIYMTSVDTGWITDEKPVHEWEKRKTQPPPLDEVDAAMRILDPILMGVKGEEPPLWGVFLKNYFPTRW